MPGNDLIFYGTTGTTGIADGNPSTPDPADWLGRFRAPNPLHEFQSTLTANQSARSRHYVVDSSRIGDGEDAHVFKWLLLQTGSNALAAGRVMAFADATGTFKLDRLLGPSTAAIGDDYALFEVNNVWPDLTAAQAQAGEERFRCIAMRNQHGAAIVNVRVYFIPLMVAGDEVARINQDTGGLGSFIQRSDDVTDILNSQGQRDDEGGPDGFVGSGPWLSIFGYGTADTDVASLPNNQNVAIWLRRLTPENLRFRQSVAVQIVAESATGGSDPDPLAGSAIMAWDIDGADPSAVIERDRFVYIGGGARLNAEVQAAGVDLPDRPVRWTLRPGDLGAIFTDDDPLAEYDTTDDDGEVQATYIAPELEVFVGETDTVRLIIGAGDEVGDPRPRVSGVVAGTFTYAVSATGNIPAFVRLYLDPDSGFPVGQ